MAERFIKFIPSKEAFWLLTEKPNAFRLLTFIANSARRTDGNPDGLLVGQCHLQNWTAYNLTEQEYRTAKNVLTTRKHIKILETNRSRKKSTTGTTTNSTLVQIISSTVYDINLETSNDRINDRSTTDQRQSRRKKSDKKDHHPYPSASGLTDDFSSKGEEGEAKTEVYPGVFLSQQDLAACLKIKGTIEKVKSSIEFIQTNPKRTSEITDWPNALARWKVDGKTKAKVQDHIAYAETICAEFPEFDSGRGWRCYAYNDRKKDQRGLLFESESAYNEPLFIPLIDGEFRSRCEEFIKIKNMRKK
jgi:hypothetical protein